MPIADGDHVVALQATHHHTPYTPHAIVGVLALNDPENFPGTAENLPCRTMPNPVSADFAVIYA
jgi:hypothetical protein